MDEPRTVEALIARALRAMDRLETLGLGIEDEWQYVSDLVAAWRSRLGVVAVERAGERVEDEVAEAVDLAGEEAELVEDPHRAIDWLSTLPQVVLLAMGEPA